MHRDAPKSPARVLAPLALVLCALAFLFVIFTSGSGDGNGKEKSSTASQTTSKRAEGKQPDRTTYTVRTGDTLGGIAAKTGVSAEKLQELNPGLDPQALVSGQKLKLRE